MVVVAQARMSLNNLDDEFRPLLPKQEIESVRDHGSHSSVVSISKDHLGLRKLSAKWVPLLLTIDQKSVTALEEFCSTAILTSFFALSQKSHGDSFLKCTIHNTHLLPSEESSISIIMPIY